MPQGIKEGQGPLVEQTGALNVHSLEMTQLRFCRRGCAACALLSCLRPCSRTEPAAHLTRRFRTMASLETAAVRGSTRHPRKFASFSIGLAFLPDRRLTRRRRGHSIKNNVSARPAVISSGHAELPRTVRALQIGMHRFCDAQAKQCDGTSGGVGKFIHLWQNTDGAWKITRVISYDHAPAVK